MKILVISDIHSKKGIISRLASKIKPDYMFFLGDGLEVFNEEILNFDADKVFKVKGNCDLFSKELSVLKIELESYKFLLTHGHNFNVKEGMLELFDYAKKEACDIVCFGHTHKPFNESINSIRFFNPGSLGDTSLEQNSFGIIEIDGEKISLKIEKI